MLIVLKSPSGYVLALLQVFIVACTYGKRKKKKKIYFRRKNRISSLFQHYKNNMNPHNDLIMVYKLKKTLLFHLLHYHSMSLITIVKIE